MASPTYPKTEYNPPDTLVRSSHAISIIINGQAIGLIQSWSPTQTRGMTPIYELNSESSGLVLENVPGNMSGLTISVARFDLWISRMEQAFGTTDLSMLSNQKSPFAVQEHWKSPTGGLEAWQYDGCWFSSLGRAFSSTDSRVVNVNATLAYVYKSKIAGF